MSSLFAGPRRSAFRLAPRSMRFLVSVVAGIFVLSVVTTGCTPDSTGSPTSADSASTSVPSTSTSSTTESSPSRAPQPDSPRTVPEKLADATVEARIKQTLAGHRGLRQFTFSAEVVRGRVTIYGEVDSREQYDRVGRIVRGVEGVEALTNRVTVDGKSISSDGQTAQGGDDPQSAYHVVQRGESLWSIAREYDVPVDRLRRLNSDALALHPGERLRVR